MWKRFIRKIALREARRMLETAIADQVATTGTVNAILAAWKAAALPVSDLDEDRARLAIYAVVGHVI